MQVVSFGVFLLLQGQGGQPAHRVGRVGAHGEGVLEIAARPDRIAGTGIGDARVEGSGFFLR